jgi:hypothetical protein
VAAFVGSLVDVVMHRQNRWLALSFAGWELGGPAHDPALELGDVAMLSAMVGLAGTIVLWLVNALCIWAESHRLPARQAERPECVARTVWAAAFGLSLLGRAQATSAELNTSRAVMWLSIVAISGLALRRLKTWVDCVRERRNAPTVAIYRQNVGPGHFGTEMSRDREV